MPIIVHPLFVAAVLRPPEETEKKRRTLDKEMTM